MKPRMNPRRLWLLLILALALALTWSTAGAAPAAIDLPVVQLPPVWTADGDQKGAEFASAVAGVGDVNADGYADLLFGAPIYQISLEKEGAAFLYLGGAGGLQARPDWTAAGGQKGSAFGTAVAAAGDVNGDGFDDVLIGAPKLHGELTTLVGGVAVFYGSSTGLPAAPDRVLIGDQQDSEFGSALAGAGDVNKDGYDDVIVGAPFYANDSPLSNQGRVFLYLGGPGGLAQDPAWTFENYQNSAHFGHAVGAAGDLNKDGYDDVFVGAPSFDNTLEDEGAVFVFYGGPGGLADAPNWDAYGGAINARFGSAVAAGDVHADGYLDLLVGAPNYPNGLLGDGMVFLFNGQAGGLAPNSSWSAFVRQTNSNFGAQLAGAQDINGDGYNDMVVGAPLYEDDQRDEGSLFVFYGGPYGLSAAPQWMATGDKAETYFAYGLDLVGDIDGDGYADVAAGAPAYFLLDKQKLGRLFLFSGLADEALPELQLLTHLPLMLRQSAP